MLGYLQNITKNETFKLYVSLEGIEDRDGQNRGVVWRGVSLTGASWTISKDGASPVALTNTPVNVNGGQGYIQLTAEEMNADVIMVYGSIYDNSGSASAEAGYISSTIIYTGSASGGSGVGVSNFTAELLSFLVSSLSRKYFLRAIDLNSTSFNYYGFARTGNVWTIVRENKSTSVLEYAVKQPGLNDKRFLQAYVKRSSLIYSTTAPF